MIQPNDSRRREGGDLHPPNIVAVLFMLVPALAGVRVFGVSPPDLRWRDRRSFPRPTGMGWLPRIMSVGS